MPRAAPRPLFARLGMTFRPKPGVEGARKPVVLVTGASEGIGFALALRFAREGCDVMLVARSAATLAEAAEGIRALSGRMVYEVASDLTTPAGIEAVDSAVKANDVYVFILINNAGVGYGGEFAAQGEESLRRLIDLNMGAMTQLTRRYLPDMVRRGAGGVLNIGSLGGFSPGPYQAAYYASKAYVLSLTQALAQEAWGSGARISVVAPGPVTTKFHQRAGALDANYLKFPGAISAERAARDAYLGFFLRQAIIVPGVFAFVASIFTRILPHFVLTPFIGWLLKKRY